MQNQNAKDESFNPLAGICCFLKAELRAEIVPFVHFNAP